MGSLLLLLLACGKGVNLAGDWSGPMVCGEEEYAVDVGPVEKIGGLWQGPGVIDYGLSGLGARELVFDLEIEVLKDDELDAQMYDCELEYAGEIEESPCLGVQLILDREIDRLEGAIDNCLVELDR